MKMFIKELKEKELLLQKPDVLAFCLIGEDSDLLICSADYIYNIRPALSKMVGDLENEEMKAYVERARIFVLGAESIADVYSEENKCIVGSSLVKPFTFGIQYLCTVDGLLDMEEKAAVALLQEKINLIYGGEEEKNED